jgi:endonuclease YncB( thermonuclease family)
MDLYTYNVHRFEVLDGDTIPVWLDLGFDLTHYTRVRVSGVDTPEKRGSQKTAGLPVRAAVIQLLHGRTIWVRSLEYGKYARRVIGEILYREVEGDDESPLLSLTDWLLDNKLALPYGGKTKHQWTQELLDQARDRCKEILSAGPDLDG